jgi:hypothetical protein
MVAARTEYRDWRGVLIGTTERVDHRIEARDRAGRLVGTFDLDNDITRGWDGVKVGIGNLLPSLFITFIKTR